MTMEAAERAACAELALAAGTEFEGIHRFIPAEHEPWLLATEAFFRSVRDVPLSVSDPSVGMAKLSWWHKELSEARERGSQHPVARALLATGALARLDPDTLNGYLHGLMLALQEESMSNSVELEAALSNSAGHEARLLLGTAATPGASFERAASAARLLELARTLSRTHVQHDWLPMDLVARHGVSRSPGGEGPDAGREALVLDLAEMAMAWRQSAPLQIADCGQAGASFIMLRDGLVARRLQQAMKAPGKFLAPVRRGSFGEVFTVWNLGRRLQQRASWGPPDQ